MLGPHILRRRPASFKLNHWTDSRTKAPEYALFMLNRQAVKNVTIPLVPGEMKATVIDASMLQVARRGESESHGRAVVSYEPGGRLPFASRCDTPRCWLS